MRFCYNVACFMFWSHGMWDLSSLTRDGTHTPCIGRQSSNTGMPGEVPFWMSGFDPRAWMILKHYICQHYLVPLFNEPLNTGVPGTGCSPQRPVSGDALSGNACTIPLVLVRLHVTCQLRNPSPQDTEHSDHVPVSHLRSKTIGA